MFNLKNLYSMNLKRQMRFAFVIAISISLYSCCKTIDCEPFSTKNINVSQFTKQESDTFIIRRYKQGTNFVNKIDTLLVARDKNATYSDFADGITSAVNLNIDVKYAIAAGFDYELYFPATNTLRRITEFTDVQGEIKYCNPSLGRNSCMNQINSLKLDGRLITGGIFPAIIK